MNFLKDQNEKELLGKNDVSKNSTEPFFDYSKKFPLVPALKNVSLFMIIHDWHLIVDGSIASKTRRAYSW